MASKTPYLDEWQKKNIRRFILKLSKVSEGDMIEWLENKESMQGYIKSLIRADMVREGVRPPDPVPVSPDDLRALIRDEVGRIMSEDVGRPSGGR